MTAKLGDYATGMVADQNYVEPAQEWYSSNLFAINVQTVGAPSFDSPGYDNAASYQVGDTITLTPQMATTGNPVPTYSITGGALPAGTTLSPSTGIVTGTLTSPSSTSFNVTATNSEGSSTTTVTFSVLAVGDFGFSITDCRAPDQTALGDRSVSYKIYDISDNSFIAAGTAASVSSAIEITDAAITQAGVNYELTITVDGQTWSLNFPSIASVEIV